MTKGEGGSSSGRPLPAKDKTMAPKPETKKRKKAPTKKQPSREEKIIAARVAEAISLVTIPVDPKMGRPPIYKPEFCEQARKLCEFGATDIELADFFEVSDRTIYRWMIQFPEFCQALKGGKEAADNRVERSLYSRATGYLFDTVKITVDAKTGNTTKTNFREHVAPDTTAAIFWLKNRKKAEWRDKIEHEHSGEIKGQADITDNELARRLALILTGKQGAVT